MTVTDKPSAPGHEAPAPGHEAPAYGHEAPAPGHEAPAYGTHRVVDDPELGAPVCEVCGALAPAPDVACPGPQTFTLTDGRTIRTGRP